MSVGVGQGLIYISVGDNCTSVDNSSNDTLYLRLCSM